MQVITTSPDFRTGQASLTVSTAAVPSSGAVTVDLITQTSATSAYDGVAGVDAFKVTANDWVGIQGRQLQYEFRFMRVSSLSFKISSCSFHPKLLFLERCQKLYMQDVSHNSTSFPVCSCILTSKAPRRHKYQLLTWSMEELSCHALGLEIGFLLQVMEGSLNPEQPLAVPTVSNSITTRLPAGQGIVVLYARYLDSAATSPLGLPAGARVTTGVLNIQPLVDSVGATAYEGRRLQGT